MTQMTNASDLEHGFLFYFPTLEYIPNEHSHVTPMVVRPEYTPIEQPILTSPASPLSPQQTWRQLLYTTFALTIMLLTAWWLMTSVTELLLHRLHGVSNFDLVQVLIRGT